MTSRRNFFQDAMLFGAGLFGLSAHAAPVEAALDDNPKPRRRASLTAPPPRPSVPVLTPDVPDLPFELDGATKVFRLKAEPVRRKIAPFKTIDAWGYNGSCPGPTMQINQGDRVRIHFENALPESTSMHWHGLEVPIDQDGVPWISQKPVPPGGLFTYEFTVHQEGTFFYDAHSAMQEMIGLLGAIVVHPQTSYAPHADHDFVIVLQEWAILPSNTVPNTASMEFNWLTFNGLSAPSTTPLIVRLGTRVRLRIINLGMDHHPIHLHGNQFVITGTEGGRAPESTWYPSNTVLVGVAQAKVVEFDAKYPGAWMIHCHLPHHMMNSMSDLLRDRAISTVDLTAPQAMQQMQSLSQSVGVRTRHPRPSPQMQTLFPASHKTPSWKWAWMPSSQNRKPAAFRKLVRRHDGHDDYGPRAPGHQYEEIQKRIREQTKNPAATHNHASHHSIRQLPHGALSWFVGRFSSSPSLRRCSFMPAPSSPGAPPWPLEGGSRVSPLFSSRPFTSPSTKSSRMPLHEMPSAIVAHPSTCRTSAPHALTAAHLSAHGQRPGTSRITSLFRSKTPSVSRPPQIPRFFQAEAQIAPPRLAARNLGSIPIPPSVISATRFAAAPTTAASRDSSSSKPS